ncbi:hypothetical protein [Streptomyces sp. NPDC056169]|uniref:hypothetical protein n=1 Tax=Streptomyces sp. NPDC056169 TaxID=3345734 RepID=UPI0035E25C10
MMSWTGVLRGWSARERSDAIVLDESAMAAAGEGNVLAFRLIHRAHADTGWFLYAPSCALVEADRDRPGTAEHLAALPGITVLDLDLDLDLGLDLPAALAVAKQETWAGRRTERGGRQGCARGFGGLD